MTAQDNQQEQDYDYNEQEATLPDWMDKIFLRIWQAVTDAPRPKNISERTLVLEGDAAKNLLSQVFAGSMLHYGLNVATLCDVLDIEDRNLKAIVETLHETIYNIAVARCCLSTAWWVQRKSDVAAVALLYRWAERVVEAVAAGAKVRWAEDRSRAISPTSLTLFSLPSQFVFVANEQDMVAVLDAYGAVQWPVSSLLDVTMLFSECADKIKQGKADRVFDNLHTLQRYQK